MGIEYLKSAEKHQIPEEDAKFAMNNAIYSSSKVKAQPGELHPTRPRYVFIGPQHSQTTRLIEVLVEVKRSDWFAIYHVMPLGSYYEKQMKEDQ